MSPAGRHLPVCTEAGLSLRGGMLEQRRGGACPPHGPGSLSSTQRGLGASSAPALSFLSALGQVPLSLCAVGQAPDALVPGSERRWWRGVSMDGSTGNLEMTDPSGSHCWHPLPTPSHRESHQRALRGKVGWAPHLSIYTGVGEAGSRQERVRALCCVSHIDAGHRGTPKTTNLSKYEHDGLCQVRSHGRGLADLTPHFAG